jgi:heat shock transcription factor
MSNEEDSPHADQGKRRVPAFLKNLYKLLEDAGSSGLVSWSPSGSSFDILNVQAFSEQVLPVYFKHKNFSSFIRQLNMYDFHKVRSERDDEFTCFQNKHFRRGEKGQLPLIERKESKHKKASAPRCLKEEDL